MNTPIETQCAEAMARLTTQINRSAGQHARAIKRAFELSKARLSATGGPVAQIKCNGPVAYIKTHSTTKA